MSGFNGAILNDLAKVGTYTVGPYTTNPNIRSFIKKDGENIIPGLAISIVSGKAELFTTAGGFSGVSVDVGFEALQMNDNTKLKETNPINLLESNGRVWVYCSADLVVGDLAVPTTATGVFAKAAAPTDANAKKVVSGSVAFGSKKIVQIEI